MFESSVSSSNDSFSNPSDAYSDTSVSQTSVRIPLQQTSKEVWAKKYQLRDFKEQPIDKDVDGNYIRVGKALASVEEPKLRKHWEKKFIWALRNGATPAGRIMSNAGAEQFKPATSLINCTVSCIVEDSMAGILTSVNEAGLTLTAGCGIGYEFSTLRPIGSFVNGAGSYTSGPLSFMNIHDSMCFTVSSAGGRRGAQMGTFAVWHPNVEEFIKVKREDGRLRQFNLSLLIDDDFMLAVKEDKDYNLIFPVKQRDLDRGQVDESILTKKNRFWDKGYCDREGYVVDDQDFILCQIYKTIRAKDLWDTIMKSTYDFSEPGFLLIDKINKYNNNWFCEEIRATNPCGEQPLPPYGSCLLGSINVALFVDNPFTPEASFNYEKYIEVIEIFTRMLDNVVELNGLPLEKQRHEILYKRRHGMGILGLGSAFSLLGYAYGSKESLDLTAELMKTMAVVGYRIGIELAEEKGPAPIFNDETNGVSNKDLWVHGEYMKRVWQHLPGGADAALKHGCRFTHHTSLAPTGCCVSSTEIITSEGIKSYQTILEENGIDWKAIEATDAKHWIKLKEFTLPSRDNQIDQCDKIWYNGHEETYEIEFDDGTTFECTPNHSLFVRVGKHIVEVEAQHLTGDEDVVSY